MVDTLSPVLSYPIMTIGIVMIIIGHFFRIGAEFTAGYNFNHKI